MVNLSANCACFGNSSLISMPGTLVRIGFQIPRTSSGASGFMSYRSRWLGPPSSQIRMVLFFEPVLFDGDLFDRTQGADCALARSTSPNPNVVKPATPSCTKLRRESPSQYRSASTSIDAEGHSESPKKRTASCIRHRRSSRPEVGRFVGVPAGSWQAKQRPPIHQRMLICIDNNPTPHASSRLGLARERCTTDFTDITDEKGECAPRSASRVPIRGLSFRPGSSRLNQEISRRGAEFPMQGEKTGKAPRLSYLFSLCASARRIRRSKPIAVCVYKNVVAAISPQWRLPIRVFCEFDHLSADPREGGGRYREWSEAGSAKRLPAGHLRAV